MLSNSHFAMAVHILCALAYNTGRWIGSDDLAYSVGTNPSFLRGLIGDLKEAGLVITRKGKAGGAQLAVPAEKITLSEVYKAIEPVRGMKAHRPDCGSVCHVARNMEQLLDHVDERVQGALQAELGKSTIASLMQEFIHE